MRRRAPGGGGASGAAGRGQSGGYSRPAPADLLGCAAARSDAALINKLTVKYLRPIGEATIILHSLCLGIDPAHQGYLFNLHRWLFKGLVKLDLMLFWFNLLLVIFLSLQGLFNILFYSN